MSLIRINRRPSPRQLLVFALAWLVFVGALGVTLWKKGRVTGAEAAWIAAVVVPLAGAAMPGLLRILYVGLSFATYPIGWVVSHVVLALIYFLSFTPLGIAMRLGGYNPLGRGFDPTKKSYWQPRSAPKPPESYLRQS